MADAGPPQTRGHAQRSPWGWAPTPSTRTRCGICSACFYGGEIARTRNGNRRMAEALGLAEKIAAEEEELSRLPEDMLQNVLSFLVLKQEASSHGALLRPSRGDAARRCSICLNRPRMMRDNENVDEHLSFALDLIRDGDVCAKKLYE